MCVFPARQRDKPGWHRGFSPTISRVPRASGINQQKQKPDMSHPCVPRAGEINRGRVPQSAGLKNVPRVGEDKHDFTSISGRFFPPSPALLHQRQHYPHYIAATAQSATAAPCQYAVDYQSRTSCQLLPFGKDAAFSRVAGIDVFYPDSSSSPQQKAPIFRFIENLRIVQQPVSLG